MVRGDGRASARRGRKTRPLRPPRCGPQAANAAALAGQRVLQVWFPGVHSDVGGGYPDKGIGDITWIS